MAALNKDDIFNKLPEHFWSAFAGELVAIFGIDILKKDEDELALLSWTSEKS